MNQVFSSSYSENNLDMNLGIGGHQTNIERLIYEGGLLGMLAPGKGYQFVRNV